METFCFVCSKKIGPFREKYTIKDFQNDRVPLPPNFTEDHRTCAVCFNQLKKVKKETILEPKNYKDKLARVFVPEAKYVYDSKKRGVEVKCPRCGKILPKHSLTCIAKTFANPFATVKMGHDFANEVENAYCPKCDGFLPEHKDGCPLKK
ncbi:MAG: hypothetical protein ACREAK_08785 [Nitrosarchaeum sp.]